MEKPLATLHELKTVYTLEDFFNFLIIMRNHSEEMKREMEKIKRG